MRMIAKSVLVAGLLAGAAGAASAAPAMVANDLNLRAGPGTGYGVVAVMPGGATVDVMGCSGNWCRVGYDGATGYASASYLDIGGAAYAAAPPPAVYVGPGFRPRPHWHGARWGHRHHGWHRGHRRWR